MKPYIAKSDKTNTAHSFMAENDYEARHWVINHLDTSIEWTVTEQGFKMAIFCLDFTDDTMPRFIGFYNPATFNWANPEPYFTKEVADEIIKYNKKHKTLLMPDKLKWRGNEIEWQDSGDKTVTGITPPEKFPVGNDLIEMWAIGHGSWSWEKEDIQEPGK